MKVFRPPSGVSTCSLTPGKRAKRSSRTAVRVAPSAAICFAPPTEGRSTGGIKTVAIVIVSPGLCLHAARREDTVDFLLFAGILSHKPCSASAAPMTARLGWKLERANVLVGGQVFG